MKLLPSKLDANILSASTYCCAIAKYGLVSFCGTYAYSGILLGQGGDPCPQVACSLSKPFIRQFVPGMLPFPLHAAKNVFASWYTSHRMPRPTGASVTFRPLLL